MFCKFYLVPQPGSGDVYRSEVSVLAQQPWMRSEEKELPEDACGVSSANHIAVKEEAK